MLFRSSLVTTTPWLSVSGAKRFITVVDTDGNCTFITPLGEKKFKLQDKIENPSSNRIYETPDTSGLFLWTARDGTLKIAKITGVSTTYFMSEDYKLIEIVCAHKNGRFCFAGTDDTFIYGFKSDTSLLVKYTIPEDVEVNDLTTLLDNEDQYKIGRAHV